MNAVLRLNLWQRSQNTCLIDWIYVVFRIHASEIHEVSPVPPTSSLSYDVT